LLDELNTLVYNQLALLSHLPTWIDIVENMNRLRSPYSHNMTDYSLSPSFTSILTWDLIKLIHSGYTHFSKKVQLSQEYSRIIIHALSIAAAKDD
jgi:hypothetical protein